MGTALRDHLHQGPPAAPPSTGPPPSRWTLRTIRATLPALAGYSLSGVWRVLHRSGLRWRTAWAEQFSPDPAYAAKVVQLETCLAAAAAHPSETVVLFLDEMGFARWPQPGRDWAPAAPTPAPIAARQRTRQGLWRLVGALNARTGQVDYLDNYVVGRRALAAFYRQLDATYPTAQRIYVVQDNWTVHQHPDVLAALPRLEVVWLPTYAPWLNPIEKVWRWLRQTVLRRHRLAHDWLALRARVRQFLDQFHTGSADLLTYVGLSGDGHLAQALHHDCPA